MLVKRLIIDVALEWELDGDLLLSDMGQDLGIMDGVINGAISISAVQFTLRLCELVFLNYEGLNYPASDPLRTPRLSGLSTRVAHYDLLNLMKFFQLHQKEKTALGEILGTLDPHDIVRSG
ncbi:hypothetical protein C5167_041701 [Papaver somniferum]|nr:hypothetical protein C5167_041701 [Papaver somniferum]